MEDTNKNKRLKEVKFFSASYFSLVLLFMVFFITLSSIFKIWEQDNFLQILSLSVIIITLPFILFSTALILFRSVDTPKGKNQLNIYYFILIKKR
ncbi:hypothetical protein [Mesomycoplasma molare]|uniref:Uncharacterized protein n=1 Tax=Mesomycoplasma molare TaxID=171288 RepID=A0ABY5TUP3_9BACT|nr:hypothetical protein [Mesomycoplasma molare]UWD34370.1 hypothetical protein NX772_00885 [Mesomycoplasma molare]